MHLKQCATRQPIKTA